MTLRQRENAEHDDAEFEVMAQRFRNDCGPIDAEIDWQSFLPVIEEHIGRGTIHSYCESFLEHTAMMCRDRATVRDAVAARIQSFRCHYGGNARVLEIQGSRVEYAVDFAGTNYDAWIEDQLGRQL